MSNRINAFLVEWFDPNAQLVKTLRLNFYPDNTLELLDIQANRMFLKRIHYPKVTPQMLYIGSSINVFAKQLNIVSCADQGTQAELESSKSVGFVLIYPQAFSVFGALLTAISSAGFTVGHCKSIAGLSLDEINSMGATLRRELNGLQEFRDIGIALDVICETSLGGFNAWLDLLEGVASETGNTSSTLFYFSETPGNALQETQMFFEDEGQFNHPDYGNDNCTLCLIKPHIFASGELGAVFDAILNEGFEVMALEAFRLHLNAASEFMDVYQGVLPKYHETVNHLTEGPVLALQLQKVGTESVVDEFREFCGPVDVEVAQTLRPESLRARFGKDKVYNAVHCTDMPEDGLLESQYFFQNLSLLR